MFLPLFTVSASASLTSGKDCLTAFIVFVISFFAFCFVRKTVIADAVLMTVYTASLYAVGAMLGVTDAVFLGLSSFVSSLFGKKGILRASSIIGVLSFVFLLLCLVFRDVPIGKYGNARLIVTALSALSCAYCTGCGTFAKLLPMLSGFAVGVIFNICGSVFAEISVYAFLFCSLSLSLSSADVFKKAEDGEYNKTGEDK